MGAALNQADRQAKEQEREREKEKRQDQFQRIGWNDIPQSVNRAFRGPGCRTTVPDFVEEIRKEDDVVQSFELRCNVGGNIMTRMDHGTASHYSRAEVVNA